MIMHGPGENNLFALVHTEGDTAWLYQITKNNITHIDTIILSDSYVKNIANAMNMTVTLAPANHYSLILWNHGFGML